MSIRVGIGWGSFGSTDVGQAGLLPFVERLEEIGFDSIWVSDSATLGGPAPLLTLTAVATYTDRLKLGTNVLVAPARNAVVLAKELSTLDTISNGRLLPAFGLGVELGPEAAAMAVPKGERAGRTAEAIEIIRLLWSGEPVTYEGRFTSLAGVVLSPAPIRPGLDIWLGAPPRPRSGARAGSPTAGSARSCRPSRWSTR